MTEFFTTRDGLRLAFDDRGRGHPLLCLAGLTRNMADFASVAEAFGGRARIIRLDSRGRGQSAFDPDYRNYTVAQEAADALALLDHLGLERASILGTSRGGLIAMVIAATAPDRLAGVILNDVGPVVAREGLSDIFGYIGFRPVYTDYDDAADKLPAAMAPAGFADIPRARWRAFAEALYIERPDGLDLRYDPALRTAILEQAQGGELPEIWPLFEALAPRPVALIRGANSRLLSPETAAEMRRRLPGMLCTEVAGRGHVPFLDEPESVATIESYLRAAS